MPTNIGSIFQAGLASRDQLVVSRCDVLRNNVPILTGLRVSDGNIQVAAGQTPQRSLQLTLVDDDGDLVVGKTTDPLDVYGNEIAVYSGLLIDGIEYLCPVGVFQIQHSESEDTGAVIPVGVTGPDRAQWVTDYGFADNLSLASMSAATAIMALVSPALSATQVYNFDPSITQTIAAATFAPTDDRWAAAVGIATDIGCLLYFDPTGALVLRKVTDPGTAKIAWTFAPGSGGQLIDLTAARDRTDAANYVVATATNSSLTASLSSVAQDTDVNSPTYIAGTFGRKILPLTNSTVLTQADLDTYTQAQLLLRKGATQTVSFDCIPLPHLEVYDVLAVQDQDLKVAGKFVLSAFSVPLGAQDLSMPVTTNGVLIG